VKDNVQLRLPNETITNIRELAKSSQEYLRFVQSFGNDQVRSIWPDKISCNLSGYIFNLTNSVFLFTLTNHIIHMISSAVFRFETTSWMQMDPSHYFSMS